MNNSPVDYPLIQDRSSPFSLGLKKRLGTAYRDQNFEADEEKKV
jgi:hypothetical protein